MKPLFVLFVMITSVPDKAPARKEHRFEGPRATELCQVMVRETLETNVRIPPGGSITVACSAHW